MTTTTRKGRRIERSAFDGAHVKSVSVVALTHPDAPGELAGRIVANWSDNPAGSVCTATLCIFVGPLKDAGGERWGALTGRAGGYGYDKLSAAIDDALRRAGAENLPDLHGRGFSAVRSYLESLGYGVLAVIGC